MFISRIKIAIKYWYQRRNRGWDDSETWGLDTTLAFWIVPRLKRLKEVTNGKPLSEVIKTVEANRPLSPIDDACPQCGNHSMKKILFSGFHIISCECGYRNKIDEEQEITKGQ